MRTMNVIHNYCEIDNIDDLKNALKYAKDNSLKVLILGNGSNTLIGDLPCDTLVIRIKMKKIEIKDTVVTAQCGAILPYVAKLSMEKSLSGLEWAAQIPGSIGGAVLMHAGAFKGEIMDFFEKVTVMDYSGEIHELKRSDIECGHRWTSLMQKEQIVISVVLRLKHDDHEEIMKRVAGYREYRTKTQPKGCSLGSTFKGYFDETEGRNISAGYLIDKCNLKGKMYKEILISDKHANFLINTGNADPDDFLKVISDIRKTVFEQTGIKLQPEIRLWFSKETLEKYDLL